MSLLPRDVAAQLGRETLAILHQGFYVAPSGRRVDVRDLVDAAVRGTVEYPPEREVPLPTTGGAVTDVAVENATVLEVGRRLAESGRVAALNFASATSPGGGFLRGARAQEESLARSSGLYACLQERRMYDFHRAQHDAMYTDYAIYSPDVPVFRADSGELVEEPWLLSLITCPAANATALERYAPDRLSEVPAVMAVRARKVLAVAAHHGHRRLILGAWGCGAFGIDSRVMAEAFRDALTMTIRGVFEQVVFAITDWSAERRFIGPFTDAFRDS
jgi:uncharacterized protein (TIGR02452 family)